MESVCCLLHNLIAGGSARQWIHLLGRHVEDGGRATIVAPPGPLSEPVRAAGIETVDFAWEDLDAGRGTLEAVLAGHELAIVHWDYRVMDAYEQALSTCGRAALVIHQTPNAQARWLGPEIVAGMRGPIERAVGAAHGVALVRGEWHRQRFAAAFDLPPEELRILPPAIPLPDAPAPPAPGRAGEILALTRLSAEKAAIVGLAVEVARLEVEAGHPARLAIAGEGDLREGAIALCEERLPAGAWRIEAAPEDPLARLAAADLVVAQGQTTLEAAALQRRVLVARSILDGRAGGIALTPARYDLVARDPFGRLPVGVDPRRPLGEALAVGAEELRALRGMVERHNSLAAGSRALAEALATTA